MTSKTRQTLKTWLWADYLLYNHFKTKLLNKIKSAKPPINEKLKSFRNLNEELKQNCVVVKGDNRYLKGKFKMALPIVFGYVIDEAKPGCDLYAFSEPNFSFLIHDRQRRRDVGVIKKVL